MRMLLRVVFKDAAGVVLKSIEYTYDVNNQRIGKKIDGVVTERYVLDRNQIALVFDGQGVQKARYLYGTQVDQVLAEESGTQVRWFLADHQGTVKDVVDNTGVVIDHIIYDSFGRIVSQTNPIELRFAYTGREWDGETGQYYYRARYYDPANGRFISEDPIGFASGDTNLTRYVFNSPLSLTDPSGLISLSSVAKEVGSYFNWVAPYVVGKGNYRHHNELNSYGQVIKRSGGWRDALPSIFRGPRQHIFLFMDHYFDENGAPFDLNSKGIVDSIKEIAVFKKASEEFQRLVHIRARSAMENLKLYSPRPYNSLSDYLELERKKPVDATSENFSIGRTIFKMKATINIEITNSYSKYSGFIAHFIYDRFDDVNDFKSSTPDDMDELPGGKGYTIQGKWFKDIG
jgi:RHS repeat-associated protein